MPPVGVITHRLSPPMRAGEDSLFRFLNTRLLFLFFRLVCPRKNRRSIKMRRFLRFDLQSKEYSVYACAIVKYKKLVEIVRRG